MLASVSARTGWQCLAEGLAFPEGPAFAPDGALWCVELKNGALVRLKDGVLRRFAVGGAPNGLVIDANGLSVFCDAERHAVRVLDPTTEQTQTLVETGPDHPFQGPNDLAFDAAGSLIFTCPGNSRAEPTGSVWRRDLHGRVTRVADGLQFPNGLAFVEGGRRLVIAETYRQRLWIGEWDTEAGRWRNPRPFIDLPGPPTGPDGMALDIDGFLHVAIFGQQRIARLALDGTLKAELKTPGMRPTNCAFDPFGTLGLVVTEAERGELLAMPSEGRGATLFTGAIA